MKRWMFVIFTGIIISCYAMAKVLVTEEMALGQIAPIVGMFVVGFVAIVWGLVSLNRRTLEVLIESTDDRLENAKNVNINNLIFNKHIFEYGPKIVVIGGGDALNTVLSGMKEYTSNVTAIATVSSYGEQPTASRKKLGVPPTVDIKNSFSSLSKVANKNLEQLLNYKFEKGPLSGLEFADIYFSAMQDIAGDFGDTILKSNDIFGTVGKVIPVTNEEIEIVAELENGYVIHEKNRIQEVVSEKFTKINRITIKPSSVRAADGVIEAIKEADAIIIGPGSLYTNVIPNLLVPGVTRAIKESSAIKLYISNIMTEPGQTDDYSVSDHLNAIIDHCGQGVVDYCLYDTGEIIPEIIKKYNIEGQDVVEQNVDKVKGVKFLQRDLAIVKERYIRHDASLVAKSVIELVCDDLKYQDKHNDPQYLMLNTKLKEEKRIERQQKIASKRKGDSKKQKNKSKSKSKFSQKYSDRIQSIKDSGEKSKKKKQRAMAKAKIERANKVKQHVPKTQAEIREEMLRMYQQTMREKKEE